MQRGAARPAGHVIARWTVLVVFAVLLAFPFYWMFITTFKQTADLYTLQNNPFKFNMAPTLEHGHRLDDAICPLAEGAVVIPRLVRYRSAEVTHHQVLFHTSRHLIHQFIVQKVDGWPDRPVDLLVDGADAPGAETHRHEARQYS